MKSCNSTMHAMGGSQGNGSLSGGAKKSCDVGTTLCSNTMDVRDKLFGGGSLIDCADERCDLSTKSCRIALRAEDQLPSDGSASDCGNERDLSTGTCDYVAHSQDKLSELCN